MFLNSCRWRASVYSRLQIAVSGADDVDVVAELRLGQRLGRVVEQVAARLDLSEVFAPSLGVHCNHQVNAASPAEMAALAHPNFVPRGQALNVGRENIARAGRDPHPQYRLGKEGIGARRARSVHIRKLHDEVVDALNRGNFEFWLGCHRFRARGRRRTRSPAAACGSGPGHVEEEFAHVPRSGRAALGAQAAMQADILVFDHDAPGL